jgi:uncharacterized protein
MAFGTTPSRPIDSSAWLFDSSIGGQVKFDQYEMILKKIDEKFSLIQQRHPKQFQCQRGCSSCCKKGLSVTPIEADYIRSWIKARPDRRQSILEMSAANRTNIGCRYLDGAGACSIYEVRPVICRSHGAPTLIPEGNGLKKDICPLNFADDPELLTLTSEEWIRLDTLNLILTALNKAYLGQDSWERVPLESIIDEK